jgi:hypothetical protein
VYRELWRVFGIPADRAADADPAWLRRLQVLAMASPGEGGE